jgi:hypothetical protein
MTALVLGAAALISLSPRWASASSHREAPLISRDPAVDNTDVYAFVSPDEPDTVTLISNWIPFEEPGGGPNFYHFDENARYLIKIDRDGDAVEDVAFEWTFSPPSFQNAGTFLYNTGPINNINDAAFNYRQYYTVTEIIGTGGGATRNVLGSNLLMVPDNVGPRSTPDYESLAEQGIHDLGNGISEYAGQRDDPFFVDVQSIFDLGGLRPFNNAHLIPLSPTSGLDVVSGYNIHTTAIQIPKSIVTPSCNNTQEDTDCVIGVWSTAERCTTTVRGPGTETCSGSDYVQVSRLGNPLVNEVVIDLARKDIFNSLAPTGDAAALDRVTDPELAKLMNALYGGALETVSETGRTDLVTIFLTGIPGVNQQTNSGSTPSEQLRLNVAIAPTANACQGDRLGAIAGDFAGFPNGRRLEDDVTDIALRAGGEGYGDILAGALGLPNNSPNNLLGDGVDTNDVGCVSNFPYMALPHQGYDHLHKHGFLRNYFPVVRK